MPKLSKRCQSSSAGGKHKASIKAIAPDDGCAKKDTKNHAQSPCPARLPWGLTAFSLPAAAESIQTSCAAASTTSTTIDLQAIPMMSTTGPKSVKGVGDDECDGGKSASGARAGHQDEEFGDSDD